MSRCSGGIEGRPSAAYIRSKVDDICASARSTMGLIRRMGWLWGTRASGVTAVSISTCRAVLPRRSNLHTYRTSHRTITLPADPFLNTMLKVLEQEAEDRRHRRINRLRRESGLPSGKTWETFEHHRVQ